MLLREEGANAKRLLLEQSKREKTVPIAIGSGTAKPKEDPRDWWDWWDWWGLLDWNDGTGGKIAKTEAKGTYDATQKGRGRDKGGNYPRGRDKDKAKSVEGAKTKRLLWEQIKKEKTEQKPQLLLVAEGRKEKGAKTNRRLLEQGKGEKTEQKVQLLQTRLAGGKREEGTKTKGLLLE